MESRNTCTHQSRVERDRKKVEWIKLKESKELKLVKKKKKKKKEIKLL